MKNDTMLTAQHSTAQHSTAQHSTAQHSTAQLRRRMLLRNDESAEKNDNMIDMEAYEQSSGRYTQDIPVTSGKKYYAYDIAYIVCYNKWGSNMGIAVIGSGGEVELKNDTVRVMVNINKDKNPYFGLTKR